MKVAVIDLGTNTCNLLIAELMLDKTTILHQSKQYVKLGDNKIEEDKISDEATERTLKAFQAQRQIIDEYRVDKVKVVATSAVRQAENKINFLEKIGEETGWAVKVITGEEEAELIFNGVLLAFKQFDNNSLILDIGGGSNELILVDNREIVWRESQPTGMARIISRFTISDPITPTEISRIETFFLDYHKNTFRLCSQNRVKTLVGCSGAFDTIADIIDRVNPGEKKRITQHISIADFNRVYTLLINLTRRQRLQIKGMDFVRVDLIVPAMILIKLLLVKTGINKIIQTDFALREGILSEMVLTL